MFIKLTEVGTGLPRLVGISQVCVVEPTDDGSKIVHTQGFLCVKEGLDEIEKALIQYVGKFTAATQEVVSKALGQLEEAVKEL